MTNSPMTTLPMTTRLMSPRSSRRARPVAMLLAATLGALGACSNPERATRTLEDQGYTHVEIVGSPWFGGCDEKEHVVDEFRATNPAGRRVHGVVCSGLWSFSKAATIRFYDSP